jgi:hypothetical protein
MYQYRLTGELSTGCGELESHVGASRVYRYVVLIISFLICSDIQLITEPRHLVSLAVIGCLVLDNGNKVLANQIKR